jgi:hypothetical protein
MMSYQNPFFTVASSAYAASSRSAHGQLASKCFPAVHNVLPFSGAYFCNLLGYDHPY